MSEEFRVEVGDGRITGKIKAPSGSIDRKQPPLIVGIHGGGFTSAYFDCGEFSLLDRASRFGVPSLALDRPGYGTSSALVEGDRAIPRNADRLQAAISQIWQERDHDAGGVVLVGHSIGSAISLFIASQATEWPLLGVSFSGLALSPPTHIPAFWKERGPEEWVHAPAEFRKGLMFGATGTYPPDAPQITDGISKPAWWREIQEIYNLWADEASAVCANIRVPIHYRLGDRDALWANEQAEIDRFAKAFTRSPSVDAKLVSDSGHCIDFHFAGKAFQQEQIAFALRC